MEKREPLLVDKLLMHRHNWAPPGVNLRTVHRFALDDEAGEYVGYLTRTVGEMMLEHHLLARPPYERTWIEMGQEAYWLGLSEIPPARAADQKVGFLFDGPYVYVAAEASDKALDLTGDPFTASWLPLRYSCVHGPQVENREYMTGVFLGSVPKVSDRLATEISNRWSISYHGPLVQYPALRRQLETGMAGDLKRAIILMLMLTRPREVLFDTRGVGHARALNRGHARTYLAHHVLSKSLNAPRAVKMLRGAYPSGRHHRRHEVAGHWCQSRKVGKGCVHEWEPAEFGDVDRWHCRKGCGAKMWWRPAHERGDAALGYVTKEYSVGA